jgi:hemerythrin
MALVWREQLSVGNDVIDADHKYLIEIINRVEQLMGLKNPGGLAAELDRLTQYSTVHFEREEKIAAAVGYTQVPNLNDSHGKLLERLSQVRGEFDAVGTEWSQQAVEHFTAFLRNWLIDHVIKEDLLMKPVLNRYSPSFDPR